MSKKKKKKKHNLNKQKAVLNTDAQASQSPQKTQTFPHSTSSTNGQKMTPPSGNELEELKELVMQEAILLSTNKKSSIFDLVRYAEKYEELKGKTGLV